MSYQGDGDVSAVLRPDGEVESLQVSPTTSGVFIAPGSLTAGRFGLFRWDMAPQSGGAGAHFHRTFSESFFILSGAVQLFNGETWTDASVGDFLYVPEGGIHGFRNSSGNAASTMILFTPGPPRERYFQELAEISASGRRLSDEEWTELFARHDQYMV
jgi:mannose-6-phosphate isomerase-like protein (cupin superfamily)